MKGMIAVEGLRKAYGKQSVLRNINLVIRPGNLHGLTGSNGSGKSTLLNILGGILKADSGKIMTDDNEPFVHNVNQRRKTGCVFEKPLYMEKLTGREFLLLAGAMYDLPEKATKERTDELLDFFELTDHGDKLIENYSKGMRSKISLATAIIHHPQFLFLDEPFDGIDDTSVAKIITLLTGICENGATVLVISHQNEIMSSLCHTVSRIEKGEII